MQIVEIKVEDFERGFETTMLSASSEVREELLQMLSKFPEGAITLKEVQTNIENGEFDFIDNMAQGKATYNVILRNVSENNCSHSMIRFLYWMYDKIMFG